MANNKRKNSLIELLRFVFALNVVKNHGYFPYTGAYFSPGRLSVEFFFVLGGYLFVKGLERYDELPLHKGLFKMYREKLFGLGAPLFIGLLANVLRIFILRPEDAGFWGYLWYVHDMLIVYAVYVVLRKLIKNDKAFWTVVAVVTAVAAVMRSTYFYSWGYFRAAYAISAGMLMTRIPKINFKNKLLPWLPVGACLSYSLRMLLFDYNMVEDAVLNLAVYPALIYFAFQVDCHIVAFDILGSLSFGMYAYQCVARLAFDLACENKWLLFWLIMGLSALTVLIRRLVYKFKSKRRVLPDNAT